MAYISLLSLSLGFLVLFHGCIAQMEQVTSPPSQQKRQLRQDQCQLRRITSAEPSRRFQSEAGVTEIWDENDEQFHCVGVVAMRHTIQARGLLLPQYVNGPRLIYVLQGNGVQGSVFPGCPETYQSPSQSHSAQGSSQRDQHQKVRQIHEGDVIALPAGVAQWIYNNGRSSLILLQIIDTSNPANQLDQNHRDFFLAGNPQQQLQSQRGQRRQSRGGQSTRGREERSGNVFSGFDERLISEAFNIDTELARKMGGKSDNRGIIVSVEQDLEMLTPQRSQEEERYQREEVSEERGGRAYNGLEETFCNARLEYNINDPSQADTYNPNAGRLTTINSNSLPILAYLRLSVQKGILYSNAMMTPHWNLNAHTICYITRGSGRVQIINDHGETMLDGQVREGQILTIPQNFVAMSKASNEGLEWVSFKTNDNPKMSQIAGSVSVIKSMPEKVIANAFQVSREDARRLKENRREIVMLSPSSRSRY
ncbi:11S globulin subunit beta precursor, putative [Ricinus communis]|uniref:11S globulin subunit beta, putative n=1 Tax=Ricinus communis TaxID=3988 RepID=B9SW16_RICCO|nr:11S globulin subunit beta precursor, putative [Ricinus communis]|eukprot:XP_002530185.1 legumin B [Ricinus communis]